jgi:hypothetical protein
MKDLENFYRNAKKRKLLSHRDRVINPTYFVEEKYIFPAEDIFGENRTFFPPILTAPALLTEQAC